MTKQEFFNHFKNMADEIKGQINILIMNPEQTGFSKEQISRKIAELRTKLDFLSRFIEYPLYLKIQNLSDDEIQKYLEREVTKLDMDIAIKKQEDGKVEKLQEEREKLAAKTPEQFRKEITSKLKSGSYFDSITALRTDKGIEKQIFESLNRDDVEIKKVKDSILRFYDHKFKSNSMWVKLPDDVIKRANDFQGKYNITFRCMFKTNPGMVNDTFIESDIDKTKELIKSNQESAIEYEKINSCFDSDEELSVIKSFPVSFSKSYSSNRIYNTEAIIPCLERLALEGYIDGQLVEEYQNTSALFEKAHASKGLLYDRSKARSLFEALEEIKKKIKKSLLEKCPNLENHHSKKDLKEMSTHYEKMVAMYKEKLQIIQEQIIPAIEQERTKEIKLASEELQSLNKKLSLETPIKEEDRPEPYRLDELTREKKTISEVENFERTVNEPINPIIAQKRKESSPLINQNTQEAETINIDDILAELEQQQEFKKAM